VRDAGDLIKARRARASVTPDPRTQPTGGMGPGLRPGAALRWRAAEQRSVGCQHEWPV